MRLCFEQRFVAHGVSRFACSDGLHHLSGKARRETGAGRTGQTGWKEAAMFDNLQDRLGSILNGLTGRGALSEKDVAAALREVRRALLEADVALEVVRGFTDRVREKAVGADVVKSIKPGQMVVKIVHDELVETLGKDGVSVDLNAPAPVVVMMVGLQGSGKTTTSGKIAKRFTEKQNKKVLMASLDTRRPAAQEQLRVLGEQTGVATLPIIAGQGPVEIASRARQAARLGGYDVLILDTAGRTHIDEPLMVEIADINKKAEPHEILLVADSLTGQDAVNLARSFDSRVGITGIVLTRVDGDGRGGAALSMRAVTGKPIKLIGTGEKMDALEDFHPSRIADRILGMGDIVSARGTGIGKHRRGKGRGDGQEDAVRQVRPQRSRRADRPDAEDGRHGRPDGHDARHGQDEGSDGRRPVSTTGCSSASSPSSPR